MTKSDAAVVLALVDELTRATAAPDESASGVLHKFSEERGIKPNVAFVIIECCNRLREQVALLPDVNEAHNKAFMSAIDRFEALFGLRAMASRWKDYGPKLKEPSQALLFLDYAITSQGSWQKQRIEIAETTQLLDELDQAVGSAGFSDHLKRFIRMEIAKLRLIIENHERFGAQDFWKRMQQVTGLFGSLFETLDDEAKRQAEPVLRKLIHRLRDGVSISADVAQLSTTAFAMLPLPRI